MRSFIAEIRRRRVHRAALIYVVGAYATVEAADLLASVLQLPEWSARLVFGLVVVGFPLAIALAWIFQITPEGLERTPAGTVAPEDPPARPDPGPVVRSDGRTSILVAPVEDQGLAAGDEFIADGLTDEIIADLSQIPSLRVISRASTMRLKGVGDALRDTARDMGVDYILRGSVRKSGDDLRITLQLIHLETEESRWSERFKGTFADLFKIHDEVARSVAEALAVRASSSHADRARLEDPRAVESYLRARYQTWKFSREGLQQAERHLENSLDIVGPNAGLYASLGHAHAWYAQLGLDPDGTHLRRAAECTAKVFELDPDSSRGHWLDGMVHFQSGDLRAARAPLSRSLEGNPNDPDTLMMLGYVSALSGQHGRALDLFERAADVDPLTPLNNAMPGFIAVLEGRFEEAVPYYRRYRAMDPHSPFAVWCSAWSLLYAERIDEAAESVDELRSAHADSLFTPLGVALLHGVRGERSAALATVSDALRGAAQTSEFFSREVCHCLALAGETEEALHWFENTLRIGNVDYPFWMEHDPWVAELRSEPRFTALMAQVEREWRSLNPS